MGMRLLMVLLVGSVCVVMAGAASCTVAEGRDAADSAIDFLCLLNANQSDYYFHRGQWTKAVAALDREIALNPTDLDPYSSAAWLLWSNGQVEEAMHYYDRMIAANPDDPEGYFTVGTYYQFHNRYAEALPWFEQALAHGLRSPERHMYGHTLEHLGRTADALAFWKKLAAEDPKDEVAKRQVARLSK